MCSTEKPIFRELTAEDPEPETTEIESLCMNCHENGSTRLLLTKIPHYREVVIMSFSCPHCGHSNNELQSGGMIAPRGVRLKLTVAAKEDLDRQVVKSDYTSVRIEEVDFEIPAMSQKGEVTTVEGILERAISGLLQDQPSRRREHPADADLIDTFVEKLRAIKDVETNGPFTLLLEDISGNNFIENPEAPQKDPRCTRTDFVRSKEQDHQLGIFTHEEATEGEGLLHPVDPEQHRLEDMVSEEVMTFRTNCPECNAPCDTNMKMTNIPHFKDVVIMATNCEACGHRTNEVKSGGGIEEQGVRMEVLIRDKEDFSRDVLKSDTCSLEIPELDMEVGSAALGGRFTTAEGLLRAVSDQLQGRSVGDSLLEKTQEKMENFLKKLEDVLEGRSSVTLVLDDPAGNSYVQSLSDVGLDDGLKITKYNRTHEQNEDLGLNDIKTEGYEAGP